MSALAISPINIEALLLLPLMPMKFLPQSKKPKKVNIRLKP